MSAFGALLMFLKSIRMVHFVLLEQPSNGWLLDPASSYPGEPGKAGSSKDVDTFKV